MRECGPLIRRPIKLRCLDPDRPCILYPIETSAGLKAGLRLMCVALMKRMIVMLKALTCAFLEEIHNDLLLQTNADIVGCKAFTERKRLC